MSEITLSEAAAEASKWGALIRSLGKIQDVTQAAVALEQNRAERQAALDKLGLDVTNAQAQLAGLIKQVEAARAQAAAHLADAQQQGSDELRAAHEEARHVVSAARHEADLIEAQAQETQASAAQAQKELDAARAELASTVQKIKDAKADALARLS